MKFYMNLCRANKTRQGHSTSIKLNHFMNKKIKMNKVKNYFNQNKIIKINNSKSKFLIKINKMKKKINFKIKNNLIQILLYRIMMIIMK